MLALHGEVYFHFPFNSYFSFLLGVLVSKLYSAGATMVKMANQPKRSVLLDFLAEIEIKHQDKIIACSFEIIS